MATRIQNRFPIDTKPRVAVGVSIPFNGPAVFNSTYQTKDQIKSNLLNYFMTNRGERLFNPSFGANLRATVFEQITANNIDGIKLTISADIKRFFPMVTVNSLDVYGTEDLHVIQITLNYSVINFGINDTLELTLV
jgi:phage baseplate assembly protein W